MATASARRLEILADTLRRFVRRGARGHLVKMLSKLRPGDVAVTMRALTPAERFTVFETLCEEFPDSAGEVLTELEPPQRVAVLERLGPEDIASILERVPVDDAVFLIESLPPELQEPVLKIVDLRDLAEVQNQLTYEDDSAGRIMDPGFFALPESTTVAEATQALRGQAAVEMIFYLYVVDAAGKLTGVTSLRQLLLSEPAKTLADIAQRDVIHVYTDTDQEEVAQLAARYDLLAIPVTDYEERLLGIVTLDDIMDVIKEEVTEDFFKMVGTSDDELLYQERSLRVARIRLPWLLVNLVGGVLTGILLQRFQVSFKEALFLLAFVPVIMGMGGNCGTQTSTITVRGLATGRIALGQGRVGHFLLHQVKVGVFLGLATGAVVALVAYVMEANPVYAAVVGCSLLVAVVVASLNGTLIPLLAEKLGIDPAVAAGPIVSTSNDITGILIYFGLAALLIDYLVR